MRVHALLVNEETIIVSYLVLSTIVARRFIFWEIRTREFRRNGF